MFIVCVDDWAQVWHTIPHQTVLITFPSYRQSPQEGRKVFYYGKYNTWHKCFHKNTAATMAGATRATAVLTGSWQWGFLYSVIIDTVVNSSNLHCHHNDITYWIHNLSNQTNNVIIVHTIKQIFNFNRQSSVCGTRLAKSRCFVRTEDAFHNINHNCQSSMNRLITFTTNQMSCFQTHNTHTITQRST